MRHRAGTLARDPCSDLRRARGRRDPRCREGARRVPGDRGRETPFQRRSRGACGARGAPRMMRLSEAAALLNARTAGGDVTFTRVSTDTRSLENGDLFVALRGERFDGHAFVAQAQAAGAVAAMVDESGGAQWPLPALIVDDTRLALGRLAAQWRSRFSMPLVALTGS